MLPALSSPYLGLALRSPLVVGAAAPLSEEVAQLQALERAGIKSNLGWSYGLQALEMGSLMRALPGR